MPLALPLHHPLSGGRSPSPAARERKSSRYVLMEEANRLPRLQDAREGTVVDPLREGPLLAAGGRGAGVERQAVRLALQVDVGEEEGVAGLAAIAQADLREGGLAAVV